MMLSSAPLIGWAGGVFYFQDNRAVLDLLVALLAGAVIYKLFKHELPDHARSSFVWFLVGVLVVVALDIAAHFLRLRNDSIEHVNYDCIHGSCNALPGSR